MTEVRLDPLVKLFNWWISIYIMDDYERIHLVKAEVFVYNIPPRPSNRGYRASDWKLDAPDFTGRLKVVSRGEKLFIKIEDKVSGELFAQCPIEEYPGVAIEAVLDSSRYFVVRIQNDAGQSANVGIGFADRGDSFDLNVALQDYFKGLKNEQDSTQAPAPKLDLAFKEGQTIKIQIKKKDAGDDEGGDTSSSKARSKAGAGRGAVGFIAPPPSAGSAGGAIPTLGAPPMASNAVQRHVPGGGPSPLTSPSVPNAAAPSSSNGASGNLLDLDSSSSSSASNSGPPPGSNWVTF